MAVRSAASSAWSSGSTRSRQQRAFMPGNAARRGEPFRPTRAPAANPPSDRRDAPSRPRTAADSAACAICGPSTDARCSIRLCGAAEAGGADEQPAARRDGHRLFARRRAPGRQHAAERRHLARGDRVPGMVRQVRDSALSPTRGCSRRQRAIAHRVLRMRAHAVGQRVDAAQGQPAIEGRRHRCRRSAALCARARTGNCRGA